MIYSHKQMDRTGAKADFNDWFFVGSAGGQGQILCFAY